MTHHVHDHRLVLVAPDRLFRETLAARLSAAEYEVAQVTQDLREVGKELLRDRQVVLIVHTMQENNGEILDMLRDLKRSSPEIKILVVGKTASAATISACLEIGVNTILDQDVSFETFLNYLRFITLDEQTLPAAMVNTILRSVRPYMNSAGAGRPMPVDLSLREKVVLAYLTEGASNKEIARYLGLADGTIKVALKAILRKINANNRTQAAIWALQHDIRDHVLKDGVELDATPMPMASAHRAMAQVSAVM